MWRRQAKYTFTLTAMLLQATLSCSNTSHVTYSVFSINKRLESVVNQVLLVLCYQYRTTVQRNMWRAAYCAMLIVGFSRTMISQQPFPQLHSKTMSLHSIEQWFWETDWYQSYFRMRLLVLAIFRLVKCCIADWQLQKWRHPLPSPAQCSITHK